MEKEFVSYEQAVALKELGFDEQCFAAKDINDVIDYGSEMHGFIYNRDCQNTNWIALPLKQQAFRWFREKYGLLGYVDSDTQEYGIEYSYHVNILKEGDTWFKLYIDTYEKAENACIEELITLAKKQDK